MLDVNGGSWKSEVVWHLGTMTGGAPDRRCFRTFEREVSLTFDPDLDDRPAGAPAGPRGPAGPMGSAG